MNDEREPTMVETILDSLLDRLDELLREVADQPPAQDVLYHFTDATGVIGILKSHSLWASRARCCNDAAEIQHGLDIAKKYLDEGLADRDLHPDGRDFRRAALAYLDPGMHVDFGGLSIDAFVTSLCPADDESLHWLHYGRGGDGYALGF